MKFGWWLVCVQNRIVGGRHSFLIKTTHMQLCVLIRTHQGEQAAALPALLASLISAHDNKAGTARCATNHDAIGEPPLQVIADVLSMDGDEAQASATHARVLALSREPFFAPRAGFRIRAHRRASDAHMHQHLWARCGEGKRATLDCGRRRAGIPLPRNDSCGYLQTDIALERLLARGGGTSAASSTGGNVSFVDPSGGTGTGEVGSRPCDYVLVTNGDNLYARALFSHACPLMARRAGLIGWFFSTHYNHPHIYVAQGRTERAGPNTLFRTKLKKTWVDLGAVMIRADLLRAPGRHTPARGIASSTAHPSTHTTTPQLFTDCGPWREADGRLIERLVKANTSAHVLDRLLFLHQ